MAMDRLPAVSTEEVCPFCGQRQPYVLGDGRRKCRQCRVKFTLQRRPGRLAPQTVGQLAWHFWQMNSIDQTAREQGLDRKTVQRYFSLLRKAIADWGERRAGRLNGGAKVEKVYVSRLRPLGDGFNHHDTITVFGAAEHEGLICLVFPGVISDWSGLDLGSLRCLSVASGNGNGHGNGNDQFWSFASQRLKHYRGGFKKRLPLYLREMEFRYNHRDDAAAVATLTAMIAGQAH